MVSELSEESLISSTHEPVGLNSPKRDGGAMLPFSKRRKSVSFDRDRGFRDRGFRDRLFLPLC